MSPDPSACQLIQQFLQQAETEMASLVQSASDRQGKLQGPPGAIPIPVHKVDEGRYHLYWIDGNYNETNLKFSICIFGGIKFHQLNPYLFETIAL